MIDLTALGNYVWPVQFAYYERLSLDEKVIYELSDHVPTVRLRQPSDLWPQVATLRSALEVGTRIAVQSATTELADALTTTLEVAPVTVKVHATRPSSPEYELHGLYIRRTRRPLIEVWMLTAKKGRVVAFRTYLRTMLHELCHHLDFAFYGLPISFHTQGFYRRESSLMHQLAPKSAPGDGRTIGSRADPLTDP